MKIEYIGDHQKIDSIPGVGLMWEPGQRREVSAAVAERLLVYRDTWIRVADFDEPVDISEQIDLAKPEKPAEEPLPVIDFHGMTKDEMVEFASREWNEKLDKRQSAANLRQNLIALFGKHQATQ